MYLIGIVILLLLTNCLALKSTVCSKRSQIASIKIFPHNKGKQKKLNFGYQFK